MIGHPKQNIFFKIWCLLILNHFNELSGIPLKFSPVVQLPFPLPKQQL